MDEDKIDVGSVSTLYEVDIYSASSDSDTFGERKRFSEGEGAKGAKKAATHAAHFAKDATNADDARMAKDAKDSKADGQFDADINKTLLVHRTEAEDAEVGSETNMELSCISVSREYGPDWKEAKSGTVQTLIDGEISKSLKIDKKQRQTRSSEEHLFIAAAKQALRMRNDVQPYKFNAKSPGGSTIETFMFLPHEALRSLASGTALDQLCLPRDEVDTGHGLSVLLRRWAQDPAVDCDATQAAEAVAR